MDERQIQRDKQRDQSERPRLLRARATRRGERHGDVSQSRLRGMTKEYQQPCSSGVVGAMSGTLR